jgi:tetratricopeptide (TPR) repeat protein
MKHIITIILTLLVFFSFAQEKEQLRALKKANNYVYEGNELLNEDDFVSAEMEYRKAISEQSNNVAGIYNLGNSYYKKGNFEEALYRHEQVAKSSISKVEKHKAFHNIGNILMQNKKCKEAVEAFKNALRNNPSDDETRYNLGLAKECAEQQKDDQKDDDKKDDKKDTQDKKDKKKDKEGDNKEDKKDKGNKDKKDEQDKKDEEGKPKDEKKDKGKGDEDKKKDKQKPKPQPGQLSPQQIKNLLEAMNNQEQKVQEKINAKKEKGVKIKTEKDW